MARSQSCHEEAEVRENQRKENVNTSRSSLQGKGSHTIYVESCSTIACDSFETLGGRKLLRAPRYNCGQSEQTLRFNKLYDLGKRMDSRSEEIIKIGPPQPLYHSSAGKARANGTR